MNSNVLRLILFITLVRKYLCETVLKHDNELKFGKFFLWNICVMGSFATSFEIKADIEEKNFSDQQGMTGIRIYCTAKNGTEIVDISSRNLQAGTWKGKQSCPPREWLIGFRIQIQNYGGWVRDDTAANNIEMICSSNVTLNGEGTNRGDWNGPYFCPLGEVICGLRTKAEDSFTADKAGIVAVQFTCCSLTNETRTTMDPNSTLPSYPDYDNELFESSQHESTFFNSTFPHNASSHHNSGNDNNNNTLNTFTNSSSHVNKTEHESGVRTPSSPFNSTSETFVNDGKRNDTRFNTSSNRSGVDDSLLHTNNTKSGSDSRGIEFPGN